MDSDKILIDPSLLVSTEAEKDLQGRLSYYDFEYYIPESFAELVRSSGGYTSDPTFNYFIGGLSSETTTPFTELEDTVERFEQFASGINYEYGESIDYDGVRDYFKEEYPPKTKGQLSNVLFDEFVFLFENSWIASRVRKPQDAITDVPGLRRFVFGREETNRIAERVPDEYEQKIRTLKGGKRWKWISVGLHLGGAVTAGAFSGGLGTAIFCTGLVQDSIALVFDP